MIKPQIPKYEKERLKELKSYSILDTKAEAEFDNLTDLAAVICNAPMALITLVDSERQWVKSKTGIDAPMLPREESFCGHALLSADEALIVEDARMDERFAQNPHVNKVEEPIIFYAGVPILSKSKLPLGTLCVIDHIPKKLKKFQLKALKTLAIQVQQLLELRKAKIEIQKNKLDLQSQYDKIQTFQEVLDEAVIFAITDINGYFIHVNKKFTEISQYRSNELLGNTFDLIDSTYYTHEFWQNVNRQLKCGNSWKGRIKYKNKSGESYWVKCNIIPFINKITGKVSAFYHIQNDISDVVNREQKHINSVIREHEKFNEAVSHNLREGISQSIAGLSFHLNAVETQIAGNKQVEQKNIDELRGILNDLLKETQSLAFQIMPGTLMNEGIIKSLYSYFNRIQKDSQVEINFQLDLQNDSKVEKSIEIQVYRTIVDLFDACLARSPQMSADLLLYDDNQGVGVELSVIQNEIKDSKKAREIKDLIRFIANKVKVIDGVFKFKSSNQWRNFQLGMQLPNNFIVRKKTAK